MAEAALLGVAKSVLQQLASPASKEFLLLWNFDKDLKNLQLTIETITAFLSDAEQKGSTNPPVRKWLSRLRAVLYEADDLFDAISARALLKKVMSGNSFRKEVRLFFSKSNQLYFVVRTAHDVKDIKECLDGISKDINLFNFMSKPIEENPTRAPTIRFRNETSSFVKLENVIGRDQEKKDIIELLLPKEETSQLRVSVISVIGFGGLGKTTLAQFVYNDDRVKSGFDLYLWACVNYFSDLKEVLVEILTSALGSKPKDNSLGNLENMLKEKIKDKKYFLVLDDVWDEETTNWHKLKEILDCGRFGSKILATTRSTKVAQCLNAIEPYYSLKSLSEENAWDLFAKFTFEEGEIVDSIFVRLGKEIVRKCGYAPLALIIIGSMLRHQVRDRNTWSSLVSDLASCNKDDHKHIMNVLMISYNGLPPALKHCFAYCSIFPEDYKFEKDELVGMWAAQGFIEREDKKSLEKVGDGYFSHLVDRCFFQELEIDKSNGYPIYTCKMHDLLHDLAIKVAGMESRRFIKEEDLLIKDSDCKGGESSLRHAAIMCDPNFLVDPLVLSPHSKTLRTILLNQVEPPNRSFLNSILGSMKMVRALHIPRLYIPMLPDSFGELIHLRYLNLSYNEDLKKLPNSICKLQHLQTLNLKGCTSLVELPLKLGKLVSLRHLFLNGCERLCSLPSRLAEITTLVSLDRLIVQPSNGGLRYLGCLDDLCGALQIELPKNGWSDCIEDAKKSNMSKKHKLNGMFLEWIDNGENEMEKKETEAVLQAIRLHDNIEYLSIKGYAGDKLSSWVFSLSNLKRLSLYECTLEYLYHENVKLESIPCLEILEMKSLRNLKGWWREVAIPEDDSQISVSPPSSRGLKVLISDCPNLVEGMPLFRGIEELNLKNVNEKLVGKLLNARSPNLTTLRLNKVRDLNCVPEDSINFLTSLKSFEIKCFDGLEWVSSSGLVCLTALEKLEISNRGNVKLEDRYEEAEKQEINHNSGLGMPWKSLQRLRSLVVPWQRHLQGGLQYLTALEYLVIEYYENKQVEEDNEMVEKGLHLPALQTLLIYFKTTPCSCPKWIQHLRFVKELQFTSWSKYVELSMSWVMLANMNLQKLSFFDVDKVVNVDETELVEQQIQFSPLIELEIYCTEGERWIYDIPWKLFKSLRKITLHSVGNLKKIPDGFEHLTSLQSLIISGSSATIELEERCKPETGEDRHLISHIPYFRIWN